ncbi:group I truncated hemoglobin [Photobacterium proteolyticum]|uniref:group I truncated hemoglobin n=1 Tax=Photobacterium proteolyticum TaxID=1903952 RepID=UPI000AFA71CB|nr:group 1 truncated hemoglobin [Photobacterium proteolyticum]
MWSQRLTYFLKTLLLVLPFLGIGFAYADSHSQDTKSLYTRLGGLQPISVVVSDFIDVIVVDDTLNANPAIDAARKVVPAPYLKYQVTAMVCNATGGSCKYQGRSMKDAHGHLNISEKDWLQMEGGLAERGTGQTWRAGKRTARADGNCRLDQRRYCYSALISISGC